MLAFCGNEIKRGHFHNYEKVVTEMVKHQNREKDSL